MIVKAARRHGKTLTLPICNPDQMTGDEGWSTYAHPALPKGQQYRQHDHRVSHCFQPHEKKEHAKTMVASLQCTGSRHSRRGLGRFMRELKSQEAEGRTGSAMKTCCPRCCLRPVFGHMTTTPTATPTMPKK